MDSNLQCYKIGTLVFTTLNTIIAAIGAIFAAVIGIAVSGYHNASSTSDALLTIFLIVACIHLFGMIDAALDNFISLIIYTGFTFIFFGGSLVGAFSAGSLYGLYWLNVFWTGISVHFALQFTIKLRQKQLSVAGIVASRAPGAVSLAFPPQKHIYPQIKLGPFPQPPSYVS